jgi:hypothetical protein
MDSEQQEVEPQGRLFEEPSVDPGPRPPRVGAPRLRSRQRQQVAMRLLSLDDLLGPTIRRGWRGSRWRGWM